ncbi:Rossmann-like domain-containing protein, partial [Thermococcus sp.]|uniref:Rossmann-like domain-containing protein n=1 Tax=Thermococcus sp. TaxID=35749 RepID=UPI0025D6FDF1
MLLTHIKTKALRFAEGLELVDFGFALPYTWVLTEGPEGRALGVAMTLPEEVQRYRNSIAEPSIKAFIEKADSLNVVERTLGLAAINAVSQYHIDLSGAKWSDVLNLLPENTGKIAMIGNMPPLTNALRERGIEPLVFERNAKLWDKDTYSDALEYHLLPEMDVVIASASCLVNGTIDLLIDRAKKARLFVLTGPTGQLLPDFLKGTKVTHLAAMKVVDIEKALLGLKLGSFKGFEKGNRKYVV